MANPTIVIQPPSGQTRWMRVKANLLKSPMMVSSAKNSNSDKNTQNINKWKRVSSAALAANRKNQDIGSSESTTYPLGFSKNRSVSNSAQSLCSSHQSNNSRFSVRRGSTKRTGSGYHTQKKSNLLPRRMVVKAWEEPGMMGHGQETEEIVLSEIKGKRRNIVGLELIHRLFQIWQPQLAKSWRPPAKPEAPPPMMVRYRTRSPKCRPPTPKNE